MSKRVRYTIVLCIIVAAVSFAGGTIYKYEDYKPLVELTPDLSKYYFEFLMPIDIETASYWLDWAMDYHSSYIDKEKYTDKVPQKAHEDSLIMYQKIKELFIEYAGQWGD